MDLSLEDVIAERQRNSRGRRDRRRPAAPRDGVRKTTRERDDSRNIDRDWVHDKYDDNTETRRPARGGRFMDNARRRRSHSPTIESRNIGTRVRIDNLHYDISERDLEDRFSSVGPVTRAEIVYDRAGRSTGKAFLTYATVNGARDAIRDFDGAMAAGQPIKLSLVSNTVPTGPRNPFDSAPLSNKEGKSLFERVTYPSDYEDDASTEGSIRRSDVSKPPPEGIDRYVPDMRGRSPPRRRARSEDMRGGRRLGGRRDERGGAGRGRGTGKDGRVRKTQEELDAEMEDYFGGPETAAPPTANNGSAAVEEIDDADMIL